MHCQCRYFQASSATLEWGIQKPRTPTHFIIIILLRSKLDRQFFRLRTPLSLQAGE